MLTGKWNLNILNPHGEIKAVLDLEEDGNVLTGVLTDDKAATEITDGKVNGNEFSYKVKLGTPFGKMVFTFNGTVDGDNMKGRAKMLMGVMDFVGSRA